MIIWRDEGILLGLRKHGENTAIIEMFCEEHGLSRGVVRGATSRKLAPILQPGTQLDVTWKARLEEHLGSFTVEPVRSRTAAALEARQALAGLSAVCGLLAFSLPEREPHRALYAHTLKLLDLLGDLEVWPFAYLKWEVRLLEDLGFGLDLSCCAVTGSQEELTYISPRTGRAVSKVGAGDWADKLLPLPGILRGQRSATLPDILDGLKVTGHFLNNHVAPALGQRPMPKARDRLLAELSRRY